MAKRKQPTKREVAEENKSAWTRFFRETKMEMRKVIWPTPLQFSYRSFLCLF